MAVWRVLLVLLGAAFTFAPVQAAEKTVTVTGEATVGVDLIDLETGETIGA